jgi:putative toxin-antitoxin system antitoxin component (TIGR02293 family)
MRADESQELPIRWALSVLESADGGTDAEDYAFGPHHIETKVDAHDLIVRGLPTILLLDIGSRYDTFASVGEFCNLVGISERSFHRYKAQPAQKPLTPEISGRLWKLAEIIGRAEEALGSRAAADAWLHAPAMALDGRRPVDLLASPTGVEAVEDLLTRLRYDVYT